MSRPYGDQRIAEWLDENGYHPRSSKHGSESCMYLLDDLLQESELFAKAAEAGEIVYMEDYTVGDDGGDREWNTDLVVGPPKIGEDIQTELTEERKIREGEPERVWFAIDAKSVMTEHQKARRNRQRDINSFADIIHNHHPGAVTGGLLLLNIADRFKSPLRDEDDITTHPEIERVVAKTLDVFRDIERAEGEISPNIDAVGCVVVDHSNMDDGNPTTLVRGSPAPAEGDMLHYQDFLYTLVETFEQRFLVGEPPDIEALEEITDLRAALDRQLVELASAGNEVGIGIRDGELTLSDIEGVKEEIERLEELLDEIDRQHG